MDVGRVVSVNVGLPRTVHWKGRDIVTGIFNRVLEFSAGAQSDDLTVLVARSRRAGA